MPNMIEVVFQGMQIGSITFEQAPRHLNAERTAAGFALGLPFTVRLKMNGSAAPQPLLTDMSARLVLQTAEGFIHPLGYAWCDSYFLGSVPEGESSGELLWTDTLPALTYYEDVRNGKPPQVKIHLSAEVCYLVQTAAKTSPTPVPGRQLRTSPWTVKGTIDVTYPTEVWSQMLRQLKALEIVFVQIPLRSEPPTGWDAVWREVVQARNAFQQGGDIGLNASVVAARRALEAWDKIEPENTWPQTSEERKALTKNGRLQRLRWSLHQAAHPAAHVGDEAWTREDAQLILATLCALLRLRNP